MREVAPAGTVSREILPAVGICWRQARRRLGAVTAKICDQTGGRGGEDFAMVEFKALREAENPVGNT